MINRILEAVIAGLLAATVVVAFTAVIFRYALGSALSWSFEVSLALLTYITFLGAYLALRKGAHLKVDLLVKRLPRLPQGIIFLLNQGLIATIGWIMAWYGGRQMLHFADQNTTVLEISTAWYYAAVPLVGALMMLDALHVAGRGALRLAAGQEADPRDSDPAEI